MTKTLSAQVLAANLLLPKLNLVEFTWGNVSGIDRERGIVIIKPSGVEYDVMTVEDMVSLTLDGMIFDGALKPSSDTPTHLALYRAYPNIGGICHTHSPYATAFAQAEREIPAFGTTHADYFHGTIPVSRRLTNDEICGEYELSTAQAIIDMTFDPDEIPAVLVPRHGLFAFGKTPYEAVHNAKVAEECAFMAFHTLALNPLVTQINSELLDKHYYRKHGGNAYYGQQTKEMK
jgi:L-ribulose-5-phosphate 4-epimerase